MARRIKQADQALEMACGLARLGRPMREVAFFERGSRLIIARLLRDFLVVILYDDDQDTTQRASAGHGSSRVLPGRGGAIPLALTTEEGIND